MTAKDKIARRKLSLLELASDLANVSRAHRSKRAICRLMHRKKKAVSAAVSPKFDLLFCSDR